MKSLTSQVIRVSLPGSPSILQISVGRTRATALEEIRYRSSTLKGFNSRVLVPKVNWYAQEFAFSSGVSV